MWNFISSSEKHVGFSKKSWYSPWWRSLCWHIKRSDVFFSHWHQVCVYLKKDFVHSSFIDPHQIVKVHRLLLGNSKFQFFPQLFYPIKMWKLARLLCGLNVLFLVPLLCCLGYLPMQDPSSVFWVMERLCSFSIYVTLLCSLASQHGESFLHPEQRNCPILCYYFHRAGQWRWCWGHGLHSFAHNHDKSSWCQSTPLCFHLAASHYIESEVNHSKFIGRL